MKFALWMLVEDAISTVKASHSPPVWRKDGEKSRHFLKWLKSFGIDVNKSVRELDAGKPVEVPLPFVNNGAIGKYVVKFTPNQKEAKFAANMIGKTLENIARIYDVIEIPGKSLTGTERKDIYAIIQEKLHFGDPVTLRVAGDMVYKYLDSQSPKDVDSAYNYIIRNLLPSKWKGNKDVEKMTHQVLQAAMKLQNERQS